MSNLLKLVWYIISLMTILLVLINNPSTSNMNNFIMRNQFINFNSSQMLIQKLIIINIFCFFTIIILFQLI